MLTWAGCTWIPEPCSTLASGPGGPFSHRTNSVGAELFRSQLLVSSHNIPRFGLHSESASLLDMGPERWLHSLMREQAIGAASQLHRDVCLMTSNLDILDQYVSCLQASKTDITLGSREFPSAAVAAAAGEPRARQAAVQMEAMGLWRPSMDQVGRP